MRLRHLGTVLVLVAGCASQRHRLDAVEPWQYIGHGDAEHPPPYYGVPPPGTTGLLEHLTRWQASRNRITSQDAKDIVAGRGCCAAEPGLLSWFEGRLEHRARRSSASDAELVAYLDDLTTSLGDMSTCRADRASPRDEALLRAIAGQDEDGGPQDFFVELLVCRERTLLFGWYREQPSGSALWFVLQEPEKIAFAEAGAGGGTCLMSSVLASRLRRLANARNKISSHARPCRSS